MPSKLLGAPADPARLDRRKALEAARATAAATLAAVDAAIAALDSEHGADELVTLRNGAYDIAGETLVRWARSGRLVAFEVERGRLVAWSSEIRRAVESRPVKPLATKVAVATDEDPFAEGIRTGKLRVAK
jgi:hypothetical protein